MGNGDTSFDKLGLNNYGTWSLKMKAKLMTKGLWTTVSDPPTPLDTALDNKAQAQILLSVEDLHLPTLRDCTTAKQAWDALEAMHQSTTNAQALNKHKAWVNLHMEGNETITTYFSRARTLVAELSLCGSELSDKDVTMRVLDGLPSEYETTVDMLLASTDQLTLDNVMQKLLVKETRLSTEPAAHAYAATTRHQHRPPSRPPMRGSMPHSSASSSRARHGSPGAGGGGGGGRSNNTQSAHHHTSSHPFASRKCYYCGKKGHEAKHCRQKARDQNSGSSGGGSSSNNNGRHGSHAPRTIALMATTTAPAFDKHTWSFDSAADYNITPHLDIMSDVKPLDPPISITIGNGSTVEATGMGIVVFNTPSGSQVRLSKVLYAPGFFANLLSVYQTTQAGAMFVFKGTECTVQSPNGDVILQGKATGRMYQFQVSYPCTARALAASSSPVTRVQLWHRRFGHLGSSNLALLPSLVDGMTVTASDVQAAAHTMSSCDPCLQSKQHRQQFPISSSSATRPLELLHTDIMGPFPTPSIGGSRYVVTILDDYSKYSAAIPITRKSQAAEQLINYIRFFENQAGVRVKAVRSDRGGEYMGKDLQSFFASQGIEHQTTAPYTPQQNGRAERLNRTLMERTRAMLQDAHLPPHLWAEAVTTANYVRNRSPTSGKDLTPCELFWGKRPNVSHLRVFGCPAYVLVPHELRTKLDPVSIKGTFVGYTPSSKAYRILLPDHRTIKISRDVHFDEAALPSTSSPPPTASSDCDSGSDSDPGDIAIASEAAESESSVTDADNHQRPEAQTSNTTGTSSEGNDDNASSAAGVAPEQPNPARPPAPAPPPDTRYNLRVNPNKTGEWWKGKGGSSIRPAGNNNKGSGTALSATVSPDPATYKEAITRPDAELWQRAMDEEIASIEANNTWERTELPDGAKAIDVKWVYKTKLTSTGEIERYKARLVVKGFQQREGVDFTEIFAPTSKHATLRALVATVCALDLELHQLDVKTAFLNGSLEETIYIKQPPGYEEGGARAALRLHKALYGLRQAPRAWHQRLKTELEALGFTASEADPGLFIQRRGSSLLLVLVYVDDILLAGSNTATIEEVKGTLKTVFDIHDIGDAGTFIGLDITRDRSAGTLKLSQRRMTVELVQKYGLSSAKIKSTPLSVSAKLTKQGEALDRSQHGYAELIGSLLYLSVCTRPDIAQAVGALARYMSCPTTTHWTCAKALLRYLAGTPDMGITYGPSSPLHGYCDADFAGDLDTRRSTTAYTFILNGGIISWSSRLQQTVAVSTTEAEYMAASSAVKEALWLRKLISDLGIPASGPVTIYSDNQAAISLLKNPITSARSKHIDVHYHFARERVARKEVEFIYCRTDDNVADALTKALPDCKFTACCKGMGMM